MWPTSIAKIFTKLLTDICASQPEDAKEHNLTQRCLHSNCKKYSFIIFIPPPNKDCVTARGFTSVMEIMVNNMYEYIGRNITSVLNSQVSSEFWYSSRTIIWNTKAKKQNSLHHFFHYVLATKTLINADIDFWVIVWGFVRGSLSKAKQMGFKIWGGLSS